MKIIYLSGYTENRLNNLIEAEGIKTDRPTGRRTECELGHGRPIEHGQFLSEARLDYSDSESSIAKVNIFMSVIELIRG